MQNFSGEIFDPVTEDVAKEIGARGSIEPHVRAGPTGSLASLFVAWFATQSASARHSPRACLPASGWTPERKDEIALDTIAGRITVNRYLVTNGPGRAVVLTGIKRRIVYLPMTGR